MQLINDCCIDVYIETDEKVIGNTKNPFEQVNWYFGDRVIFSKVT